MSTLLMVAIVNIVPTIPRKITIITDLKLFNFIKTLLPTRKHNLFSQTSNVDTELVEIIVCHYIDDK